MMKNIFILVPSLGIGGQERQAVLTAECLRDDYHVTLVIFHDAEPHYKTDVCTVNLHLPPKEKRAGKLSQQVRRAKALRELRKTGKPVAVYSFGSTANLTNVLSSGVGRTILSLREFGATKKTMRNRFMLSHGDAVVCQTQAMKTELLINIPSLHGRTYIAYNAYDIPAISARSTEKDILRPPMLLAVGRLDPAKGYRQLLKAFALLLNKMDEAKLTFIGDGELNASLKALAESLGIAQNVDFHGFDDNPYAYMRKCGIFIMPSVLEGFPNVLVEAMACGAPVIAADCKSGPREILSDTYTEKTTKSIEYADYGVLVPPFLSDTSDEPEKEKRLAEAMEHLLTDENLHSRYKIAARERAKTFSVKKYRDQIKEIIEGEQI